MTTPESRRTAAGFMLILAALLCALATLAACAPIDKVLTDNQVIDADPARQQIAVDASRSAIEWLDRLLWGLLGLGGIGAVGKTVQMVRREKTAK